MSASHITAAIYIGMSAKEAREDLFASMDDTFKHTRDQDEQDRERLNGR